MATAKKNDKVIEIKAPNIEKYKLRIVGDSSLIVHAWSEKAKKMMLDAQQKKTVAKKAREVRDPFSEFVNAIYWIEGKPEDDTPECFEKAIQTAKTGFPATAVKQAAISAAYRTGAIPNQAMARGLFFLNGIDDQELLTIEGDYPECREDMVRLSGIGNPADLRYRPEYKRWHSDMILTFNNVGVLTLEQVVNMIAMGGCFCGIGEWRPEKDGQHGMFHVEMLDEGK